MSEAQRTQRLSSDANDRLTEEVKLLRETVGRLESSLASISGAVASMSDQLARSQLSPPAVVEAPIREDAFTLLSRGLVSDAVVRVLEDKDIATTVALLDRLTPQQVNSECSHLERLCITQQLATDMSVNKPVEVSTIIISCHVFCVLLLTIPMMTDAWMHGLQGIEKRINWIKSLVVSLLLTSKGGAARDAAEKQDPHYDSHFKAMVAVVLESIAAAKEMIFASQFDDGEEQLEGSSPSLHVSQAVCNDLQLLEFFIQSKMSSSGSA